MNALTAYGRNAVLTASPAALLTMLYDRLVLDLRRAQAAQAEERWQDAHNLLIHAQAIVAELMSSLNTDAWDEAKNLQTLYLYMHEALVAANIHRDAERTHEVLALVVPLQEAWHQAAAQLPASGGVASNAVGVHGVA